MSTQEIKQDPGPSIGKYAYGVELIRWVPQNLYQNTVLICTLVVCLPIEKKRTTEGQEGKRIAENQDIQTT